MSVLAVYGQVASFPFISLDDGQYILDNPNVLDGLSAEGVRWAFTSTHVSNWHPLTWLSHMLDVELFGRNAGGHHLVNVALHLSNSLLLFLVLARLTGGVWRSAFAAALFALHPLHVESVAWVSERKDLLAGLFWILSMEAYRRYVKEPGAVRYAVLLVCFVLGLLSKPMVVTLPFVLLLLDFWPLERMAIRGVAGEGNRPGRRGPAGLILEKVPLMALSALSCWITFAAQSRGGSVLSMEIAGPGLRAANAVVSYVRYMSNMAWPSSLAFFYPFPFGGIDGWKVAGAAAILALGTWVAVFTARRWPYVATGWFWYIGTLIPVIGLVQVGNQAMADRYTYLPSIGLFVVVSWGACDILPRLRLRKAVALAAAAGCVVALGVAAWIQAGYWKSDYSLATRALRVTDRNGMALLILGKAYEKAGRQDEAADAYREVIRIFPGYPLAWNSLGASLFAVKRYPDALFCYREAVRLRPDYVTAWINLGLVMRVTGNDPGALDGFREAIRLDPKNPLVWNEYGILLGKSGRLDEAVSAFRQALRIQPVNATVLWNLGMAYSRQGEMDNVVATYRQLVKVDAASAERFYGAYIRGR